MKNCNGISRRTFMAGAAAAGLAQTFIHADSEDKQQEQAGAQPNIVFVFADQWRAQAAGYNGDVNAHTPNLDSLAKSLDSLIFNYPDSEVKPLAQAVLSRLVKDSNGQLVITDKPVGITQPDRPADPYRCPCLAPAPASLFPLS